MCGSPSHHFDADKANVKRSLLGLIKTRCAVMQRFLARTLIRPATAGSSGALGVGSAGLPAPTPALCLASRTFQAYKSCGFGHIAALNADIWGRLARPMSSPAPILSPTLGPVGRFRTARFNFSTASKSSDSSKNQKSSSGGKYSLLGVFGLLSVPLYFYFTEHPDAKAVTVAFVRMYRAAKAVVAIAVDYKYSLRNGPEAIGEEAYEAAKSGCHARSAQRLYEMARDNGGVYIKLGQHIAAMSYVLPKEYTDAMRPLQDRCPTTSLADLDAMLKLDLGQSLNDLFAEFDPEPLGIASLAQVHRGVLRSGPHAGREVAIKLQHPYLEQFAQIDISTVSFLVVAIKTIFPSFSFDWLAAQMRENLPKELDFRVEASNARHLAHLFSDDPILKVPEIYDAHKRVMIMEFIHGARLDDRDFLAKHGIDPLRISHHFSEIFSRMIFKEGFVHADPHPGNVLIRPHPGRRDNFDLILLDHGLYRTLDAPFRRCYADLWCVSNLFIAG